MIFLEKLENQEFEYLLKVKFVLWPGLIFR